MSDYYVYIVASFSRRIYVGVTNNLIRRVYEHKNKELKGFTQRYRISRLVYYEVHREIREAIKREKEIKGWRREKKVVLIESKNSNWDDLSAGWYEDQGKVSQINELINHNS